MNTPSRHGGSRHTIPDTATYKQADSSGAENEPVVPECELLRNSHSIRSHHYSLHPVTRLIYIMKTSAELDYIHS